MNKVECFCFVFALAACLVKASAAELQVKEVREFTEKVVPSKEAVAFNQLYARTLQQVQITNGTPVEPELARQLDNISGYWSLPPDSIYRDKRYQENFRALAATDRILEGKAIKDDATTSLGVGFCVAIGNDDGYSCTGSLIAPQLVMTAGHCSSETPTKIFIGNDINGAGKTYKVKKAVPHEKYVEAEPGYDLTLLILEAPVAEVAPVKLANSTQIDSMKAVCLVGFGTTNLQGNFGFGKKRFVDVPVVAADGTGSYGALQQYEFVAVDKHGKDSCRGDSGGPALIRLAGDSYKKAPVNAVLAGVTSRGTKMANAPCGDGGIYGRVDKVAKWIEDTANANQVSAP